MSSRTLERAEASKAISIHTAKRLAGFYGVDVEQVAQLDPDDQKSVVFVRNETQANLIRTALEQCGIEGDVFVR